MKKILIIAIFVLLLMIPYAVKAQDNWERMPEVEAYFKLFEVDVEVWFNRQSMTLNFEDTHSRNFDDMLYQWSYLMQAFDFMLEDDDLTLQDLNIRNMIYSFFIIVDPLVDRYNAPNIRYDIHMDYNWLLTFFKAGKNQRNGMILDLFNIHYSQWLPKRRR